MAVRVLRAAGRPATAWLNGGGVTREVAGAPEGSGLADFDWRVSLADVGQGGPFSVFPGVDRVITLVDGAGMALAVAGTEHVLAQPYQPFAFPGDADTGCRLLGGPVVDFNVMTRRGRATAEVAIAGRERSAERGPAGERAPEGERERAGGPGPAGGHAVEVPPGATVLLVCLDGGAELDAAGVRLGRFDAALLDSPGRDLLRVDGVAAVVTLRPAG
ncbi:HutD family protein [Kitasatospora indigofera]|uniref:HutD/Ves family protein n=1 Tax=Kitasatospora indigofera TaxID=67307 RepID=UPI00364A018F